MTNPTQLSWTDPTTNVDGTPIAAGEITGYSIGVRAASGTPGVYLVSVTSVPDPAATSAALSSLSGVLVPGDYVAAVQAIGPVNSAFSNESAFTIAAPVPPTPSPPTNFTVA